MNTRNLIVLAALFLSIGIFCGAFGEKPSTVIPVPSSLKKFMPKLHQEKLREAKNNKVDFVMIGDSITHSWGKHPEILNGSNLLNLGFPGDRTQNVLWRIENGALDGISPKLVTLMIGTNNLHENKKVYPPDKPEDIFTGIQAIVSEVRKRLPNAPIVIFSIFPRKAGPAYERVKAVNALLPQLANGKHVYHLNLNGLFLNDKGLQNQSLFDKDLLHINKQGYLAWASALIPLLKKHGSRVKPNVIILMTDDQGYGDLACHGNPVIQTPNLDQLHAESIRLTDFHVSPFCTPTRASLMTGRYPARTGAYRTTSGRSNLHHDEITIAQYFAKTGYRTGMMGKWHLGDNAPCRPQDKGFQDVVWHKGGGVGQAPDHYGNDYFDDTYERYQNGKTTQEKFTGYCTDVFFEESIRFVEENKDNPFFLYISTNAPHSPYWVDEKWAGVYRDVVKWKHGAEFYGMISNLDYNLGLLRKKLKELKLSNDTILIFMTDNGTAKGGRERPNTQEFHGFNAGMRGQKSTIFEGGHRVPFFIHYPAGGFSGGHDRKQLAAHIDVLPTLAEICDVSTSDTFLDGKSFVSVLQDENAPACRDHVVVQHHGGPWMKAKPQPFAFSNVIKGPWRLHNGEILYYVGDEHWEGADVSNQHPEVVAELRTLYEKFWASVSPRMTPVCLDLGNPAENPTTLCSQDWYMPVGNPPWNFGEVNQLKKITGPWHVQVKEAGKYRITLRQLPEVANKPLRAVRAGIKIAGLEREQSVKVGAKSSVFELDLPEGKTTLETYLYNQKNEMGGAYFTEVERL